MVEEALPQLPVLPRPLLVSCFGLSCFCELMFLAAAAAPVEEAKAEKSEEEEMELGSVLFVLQT